MAAGYEQQLIKPISQRQFDIHALSLERRPNFDPSHIFSAYQVGQGSACGCILLDPERGTLTTLAMRRRIDHVWVRADKAGPFSTPEAALDHLSTSMRGGEPPEPLPPGARRRPLLLKTGSRGTSPEFDLLTSTISHFPALMAVGECYLALPNPDANFVSDLQTNNFASRLFELYLLASFREQGLIVRQDHVSPDFSIEKDGTECWIEAVTELVQAVIESANNDPRDRMLVLLMIVWRLRNNLFHGAKWAYGLRDQRENFTRANSVLMRLLERHGQLG